jgi:hypothetical protein
MSLYLWPSKSDTASGLDLDVSFTPAELLILSETQL